MPNYRKYLPPSITTDGTDEETIDILAHCAYEFSKNWFLNHDERLIEDS